MHEAHALEQPRATSVTIPIERFGTWLFLASEVMFFSGLIGAYIVIRAGAVSWPVPGSVLNIPVTAINTFVLICSSVTMVRALYSVRRGDQRHFRINLAATFLLGCLFLSVQMYEYRQLLHEGFTPQSSLFGTTFYTLTGFHGAHVFGGVVTLLALLIMAWRGAFSADHNLAVECAGLYWHFVDLVWILLFTIVYLI
jgi:heme/copper-type cytochrome/quinol oxidase subunit 3